MRFGRRFLLLAALLALLGLCAAFAPVAGAVGTQEAEPPDAISGELDLSGWDLAARGPVNLSGRWAFYWRELWSPEGPAWPRQAPLYVQVPGTWGGQNGLTEKIGNQGFGTYRLHIRLGDSNSANTAKALYMSSVATAYRVWVNGMPVAGNGVVGEDRAHMTAKTYAKVVPLPPLGPDMEIVIQVSNFVQRKGGLWSAIRFGEAGDIVREREANVAFQLLFAVSNMVLFVYHLALFLFRRNDKASLYLSLFCAALGLRTLLLGETLLVDWFPAFPWELAVKLEYLSAYAALSLFPAFIQQLYPQEANWKIARLFVANGLLFAVPVILFPARIYTHTLMYFECIAVLSFPYLFYVLVRAGLNRREGAWVSLSVGIVLMLAALNDILYYSEFIASIDAASQGMLLFVFVQTLIIAYRFTNSYKQSERLSAELQTLNTTLEQKVGERTSELMLSYDDLQSANGRLQQMVQSRRHLLSNISHELGTPMTVIRGYTDAMLDGLVPENERGKYLRSMQSKILFMDSIIRDLFDLSKLEAKQMTFTFMQLPAESLIEHAEMLNGMELRRNKINFDCIGISGVPVDARCVVTVDSVRMQQVFNNLIQNALKFTPEGGTIRIGGSWSESEQMVRYFVADTGSGITPEALPRVFDRFYQDGKNRPAGTGGSGLGLAIAKEIVEQHRGQISVTSVIGEGTTFIIDIPGELVPTIDAC